MPHSGHLVIPLVAAEGVRRRSYPEGQRLRALALVDAGWSWAQAGRELGGLEDDGRGVGQEVSVRRLTTWLPCRHVDDHQAAWSRLP